MNGYNPIALSTTGTTTTPNMGEIVENVGGMADIVQKYGPIITIMSVFLLIFIGIMIFTLRMNSKMLSKTLKDSTNLQDFSKDTLEKIIEKVLGSMEVPAVNVQQQQENTNENNKEPNHHNNLVGLYIDVNLAFKDASKIVLNKLKCERVAIYVFHNGNRSLHGLPFFKMSCVHEWTMKGSYTIRGKSHTDLPLHIFCDLVEDLHKNGECAISDINEKDIIDDHVVKFVEYSNTKSMFMLGIYDNDDNLAGFSIVEFNDVTDFTDYETYKLVKESLEEMNRNIKSIIIDDSFRKEIEKH